MTMTSAEPLPAAVLKRRAVIYVWQSTHAQIQTNLESRRRQYDLVNEAGRRGFKDIEVVGPAKLPKPAWHKAFGASPATAAASTSFFIFIALAFPRRELFLAAAQRLEAG